MPLVVLRSEDYPMIPGEESWFYIHPNDANYEFFIPVGAAGVCIKPLLGQFKNNIPYSIVNYDSENGWISIQLKEDTYKMPLYLFCRYFDAEAFVRKEKKRESIQRNYQPCHKIWSD